MSEATRGFIRKIFLSYYKERLDEIDVPDRFDSREFAGLLLEEKAMVRHKMFMSPSELQVFLCSLIPSDVYYSSAYYEQPDAPEMSAKGWIGADLVFDIDADHIPTACDKVHDEWACVSCGFRGKGITPDRCPACEGEKFDENTWPCETCLTSARDETVKLLDVLKDFAFSEENVHVYFSGHRGYHVHVLDEAIQILDSVARKEIVDYVCGLGFDGAFHGLDEKHSRSLEFGDIGWRGRVIKGIHQLVLNATYQDYRKMGIKSNVVKALIKNRDLILKNSGDLKTWRAAKGVGPETWKKIVEYTLKSQIANVDTVVTTDIHRLIRLAGTLNGKTGMKKVELAVSDVDDFDPFHSAIAFKGGEETVFVHDSPEFKIGDETFGPYRNQKVVLPTAAALLLVCKKRAEVVE